MVHEGLVVPVWLAPQARTRWQPGGTRTPGITGSTTLDGLAIAPRSQSAWERAVGPKLERARIARDLLSTVTGAIGRVHAVCAHKATVVNGARRV